MIKIPDWAMEMAKDMFSNMDSLNMDYRDTVSSIKTARLDDLDTIALALVAAEKRGIERAAEVVQDYPPDAFFTALRERTYRLPDADYNWILEGDTGNWAAHMSVLLQALCFRHPPTRR